MDDRTETGWSPIHARDANPGDMVRGKRIQRILLTTDGYYRELRVVLEDLTMATIGHDTLIQHQEIRWVGHSLEPENKWDRDNAGPRPKACPGCRVDGRFGDKIWIFREGSTRIHSTGGDSYEYYHCGVWECTNCGYQTPSKPIHDHPSNT